MAATLLRQKQDTPGPAFEWRKKTFSSVKSFGSFSSAKSFLEDILDHIFFGISSEKRSFTHFDWELNELCAFLHA